MPATLSVHRLIPVHVYLFYAAVVTPRDSPAAACTVILLQRSAALLIGRVNSTPEVVRADPRLRRLALWAVLGALLLGAATTRWLLPALADALLRARLEGRITIPLACYLFLALMLLIGGLVIAFAAYAIRFGRRVRAGALYPPAGTRVIRDTRVLRGPVAVFVGRGQIVLGYALVVCALALIALSVYAIVVIAL